MTNLLQLLKKNILPEDNVLAGENRLVSFKQLNKDVNHFSRILKKLQVSRLAIYADNSIDWVVADLACQKLEICLLPLPDYFSDEQLEHALQSSAIDYIFTDQAKQLISRLPNLSFEKKFDYTSEFCFLSNNDADRKSLPEKTQKITFTSGSSGQPKGVCLSLQQQLKQAETLANVIGIKNPVHLCLLPLSTLLENIAGIYTPLIAEGIVHIPSLSKLGYKGSRLINPASLLQTISDIQPDTLILTPQLLMFLSHSIKQGWSAPKLKFVAVGGSKVAPELINEARNLGIPAYEGYGLSECASVVSLNTPAEDRPGSCGKALPDLELQIEDNEILVSGNAMLGYLNDPESWYAPVIHTGDLGSIDADGYVHIHGRRKNLIISSYGRNISPEWVESELLLSPILAEVVVFGDAKPFCIALLSSANDSITEIQIQKAIDHANLKLPDYAQIQAWLKLDTPFSANNKFMTSNGRPRREAIADFYQNEIENLYQHNQNYQIAASNNS
jgi:long-subunit acyl-CoA synthetase (AMP-forming)